MSTVFDEQMMRRALELAARGRYSTPPNPRVGCVLTQGERVIGEAFHRKSGEAHAEALALAAAGVAARGATAYVTLEPHSHQSRTPPCSEALIRAGVRRVVCAVLDVNPEVRGNGVRQLREAGVQVDVGLCEREASELNAGFEKRMTSGLPRVIVKVAASLDGRVALANGRSQWITGEAARADVQRLRAEVGAVLTGVETVLADDPRLTVRDPSLDLAGRKPLRVVLDTRLRTPASAKLFDDAAPVLIFAGADASGATNATAEVIRSVLDDRGRIDLVHVFRELAARECNDVLVEAGPTLAGRILELGLFDELIVYLAPKVLGGDARAMLELPRLESLDAALRFELKHAHTVGSDFKLVWRPARLANA
jgi:diaminohydroxyphosphoribosylaminopyrimidine deaminase/5-amino-6-(5-phosphoribosylamino)uracil reductase